MGGEVMSRVALARSGQACTSIQDGARRISSSAVKAVFSKV
jgi:hypothetical protein